MGAKYGPNHTWLFFDCLKICPGDHGNHGELRLSTPFPYVVLRSPRFVNGGLNRDCRGRRGHSVNVALREVTSDHYVISHDQSVTSMVLTV